MNDENEITNELALAKGKAIEFWKTNRTVRSQKLGEVKITEDGFAHIEYKDRHHKRENDKEVLYRYKCFLQIKRILGNLGEYQEYCERTTTVFVKRHGKRVHEMRPTKYFGFVAVIDNRIRVKIVVKKVDGFEKCEFVSVCPVWKTSYYQDFKMIDMFEDLGE